jgi:hypothetical protein
MSTWDALRAALEPEPIPADSITAKDYADKYGVSQKRAERELKRMIDAGLVESKLLNIAGHRARAYWPKGINHATQQVDGRGKRKRA